MRIVLFALCGSYSHTCLAIRCLRGPLVEAGHEVFLVEGNLRDRSSGLLKELYKYKADVYSFSCYIWNIEETVKLAGNLHTLLPESRIILGGPEVSYNSESYSGLDFVDTVICGAGELVLPLVCDRIEKGEKLDSVYRSKDILLNDGILYEENEIKGKGKSLLYYESSRGCPFSCSYCLSSAEQGVKAKSVEQTLDELLDFERIKEDFKIVKFVDRTFNFDIRRANEIWKGLLSDKYTKKYHFEICASLLNEESFDILQMMPKGKIQLEVGLQSTNEETLREISRHLDAKKTLENCKRIKEMGNIHIHLDLIAGLPFEDFSSFGRSFDEAYRCCHQLQLGFLKLLHGTGLRKNADRYGYKYLANPPYTVLMSKWISYEEMYKLEKISFLLERYHESGNFDKCLTYLLGKLSSPFDFYCGFSDFIEKKDGREIQKISQADAFSLLFAYGSSLLGEKKDIERFSDLMHEDFSRKEVRKMPKLK